MPQHIMLHRERRCAPFVQMQAFSLAMTRSFALPQARANLCPHPDAEITPSAGRQAAGSHISLIYLSTEGLQVRPEKQLQKYGRLAMPKAVPPLRTRVEILIISTSHHHGSLSFLLSPITVRGHSPSFFLFQPPVSSVLFVISWHCIASCCLHLLRLACQGFLNIEYR